MEENTRPETDQSKEALDRATKRRQLEERRAAYYQERIKELMKEQRREQQEAEQKADKAKRSE